MEMVCFAREYKYTHVPVSTATNLQNEAYISEMAGDTTSWSTVLPLSSCGNSLYIGKFKLCICMCMAHMCGVWLSPGNVGATSNDVTKTMNKNSIISSSFTLT